MRYFEVTIDSHAVVRTSTEPTCCYQGSQSENLEQTSQPGHGRCCTPLSNQIPRRPCSRVCVYLCILLHVWVHESPHHGHDPEHPHRALLEPSPHSPCAHPGQAVCSVTDMLPPCVLPSMVGAVCQHGPRAHPSSCVCWRSVPSCS